MSGRQVFLAKPGAYSPLIYEYLRKFQEDPRSRIFAPLAEAYRRAGLVDEAIDIAREGLMVHPTFIGGRVALARALFDKRLYEQVVEELRTVIENAPDNLVAQRLVAESSLVLGRIAEALSAYKMLLYFSPHDAEAARLVQELEVQAYQKGHLVLRSDSPQGPDSAPHLVTGMQFGESPASQVLSGDPAVNRAHWMKRVELLQGMLQRVERYRSHL